MKAIRQSTAALLAHLLVLLAVYAPAVDAFAQRRDRQPRPGREQRSKPGEPRLEYEVAFEDGTRASTGELAWNAGKLESLGLGPLRDGGRPLRWMQTPAATEPPPQAYLEMAGGDRLPGRVAGTARSEAGERPGARLLVELAAADRSPAASATIGVAAAWIRRIVAVPSAAAYRPATLFFRDGRQIGFRSVRFGAESVRLLRDEGVEETAWADIGELHMPAVDCWEAYFRHLAAGDAAPLPRRLVLVDTAGGLRLTCTVERFSADPSARPEDPRSWRYIARPAWTTAPLVVPMASVRRLIEFAPTRPPLLLFDFAETRQGVALSAAWRHQTDRNVQGGPLLCGQRQGWGIGVHAPSRLKFAVHPAASGLRLGVGLDDIAAEGGCVRAAVLADRTSLLQTPPIVGGGKSHAAGRLGLPSGCRQLVLEADPLSAAPPAADPLDIRDVVDWLEPEWELDEARTAAEVARVRTAAAAR